MRKPCRKCSLTHKDLFEDYMCGSRMSKEDIARFRESRKSQTDAIVNYFIQRNKA